MQRSSASGGEDTYIKELEEDGNCVGKPPEEFIDIIHIEISYTGKRERGASEYLIAQRAYYKLIFFKNFPGLWERDSPST